MLLLPETVFAWGPLTHIHFSNELLSLGSLLPPAVYNLLRKYRADFVYGNFMPDIVIGKSYQPREDHCHSWDVGLRIRDSAVEDYERAFALGYLCHLAADTVAHGEYTAGMKNVAHAYNEMKADSLVDVACWIQAVTTDRAVQKRNDAFLQRSLTSVLFSLRTNSLIFKGVVALAGLHGQGFKSFGILPPAERDRIEPYHAESIARMADILMNGPDATVLKSCPIGTQPESPILRALLA